VQPVWWQLLSASLTNKYAEEPVICAGMVNLVKILRIRGRRAAEEGSADNMLKPGPQKAEMV
jgi:hypothetical protein